MLTRRLRSLVLLTVLIVAVFAVSALAASGKSVNVGDNYYGPKSLTVGKGTKVTWKWVGVLKHNVVVHSGPSSFNSKTQVRGTYSHTFTKKGTYQLVCTIHPSMKMTVVVK
ncbi:MAG TPA: plastocyanin/azurin family copper-binding protein [Solirubrobacteraceae bacterium]|jgi:plastocyanin|nr:plastocyanin/azurin family copper-binding protein [Solirubrobacteraceae bacterium]